MYSVRLKCHRLIYEVCFACFSNIVTIVINTFQENEKNIVDRVARLVKMCGNGSRADELIVILYGAAIFIRNPRTSINTYSRHLVTPPTPNVPSLSDVYAASARPTIFSINAVVNSLTSWNYEATVAAFPLKKKLTAYAPSHVTKLSCHDHRTTTQTELYLSLPLIQLFPTSPLLCVRI